jgi:hypothetical protein
LYTVLGIPGTSTMVQVVKPAIWEGGKSWRGQDTLPASPGSGSTLERQVVERWRRDILLCIV